METQNIHSPLTIRYTINKYNPSNYTVGLLLSEEAHSLLKWLYSKTNLDNTKRLKKSGVHSEKIFFYVDMRTYPMLNEGNHHLCKYLLDELKTKDLIEYYITND
jgi:hypothetical protein